MAHDIPYHLLCCGLTIASGYSNNREVEFIPVVSCHLLECGHSILDTKDNLILADLFQNVIRNLMSFVDNYTPGTFFNCILYIIMSVKYITLNRYKYISVFNRTRVYGYAGDWGVRCSI